MKRSRKGKDVTVPRYGGGDKREDITRDRDIGVSLERLCEERREGRAESY